jgi:hypothetical protein
MKKLKGIEENFKVIVTNRKEYFILLEKII